jgi:F-type H+-transporting ATPase subunit gamma
MELIATARFKKALDRATESAPFTRKVAELAAELSNTVRDISHPLLQPREQVRNALLLVITSNRGLCGGYNAGILRAANQRIRQLASENVGLRLEVAGKRGIAWFRYQGVKADKTYTQFEDKVRFEETAELADRYLQEFIAGRVDRVEVAYMKFINAARQVAVVETMLPLAGAAPEVSRRGRAAEAPAAEQRPVEYEFLPGPRDILEELLPVSFKVRLFKCFLDAAVSEQIARRVTMKSATENADEMLKQISRAYNRARQAQITKEIAEVIGGAAALE